MIDSNIIVLLAFTLGSIGQVVKDENTLKEHSTDEQKLHEIKRIYNGYIKAITKINL